MHGPFKSAEKSQKYMNAMRYSLSELAIGCSLVIIFLLAMIVGWIFYSIFCVYAINEFKAIYTVKIDSQNLKTIIEMETRKCRRR